MFVKKIIFLIFSLLFSAVSMATTTLDVLVVYDNSTIDTVSSLNTNKERSDYSKDIITYLNKTFTKSKLDIDFNLVNYVVVTISLGGESLQKISDRYQDSFANLVINKKITGPIYKLQSDFNADIVFVLLNSGDTSVCGKAIAIPNKDHLEYFNYSKTKLMSSPAYGIAFIDVGRSKCRNSSRIFSHELGHTLGIYHVPTELDSNKNPIEHSETMIYPRAAGYYGTSFDLSHISTVMIPDSEGGIRENRFSDRSATWGCGVLQNVKCGDEEASAVDIIKKYAENYAKRGDWYLSN